MIKEDADEPCQRSWQQIVSKRNAKKIETLRFIDFPLPGQTTFGSVSIPEGSTYRCVDGRPAIQMANNEIIKLAKSVSK